MLWKGVVGVAITWLRVPGDRHNQPPYLRNGVIGRDDPVPRFTRPLLLQPPGRHRSHSDSSTEPLTTLPPPPILALLSLRVRLIPSSTPPW